MGSFPLRFPHDDEPDGLGWAAGPALAAALVAATEHCEVGYATGRAGDVYLCHPFLVHAALANRGRRPRFLGQPAIPANYPYRLDGPDLECSPVELTLKQGLGRATA